MIHNCYPEHFTARTPEPLTVDLIQQVVSPPPSRFNHNHKFQQLFFSNKMLDIQVHPQNHHGTWKSPRNEKENSSSIHLHFGVPVVSFQGHIQGFQIFVHPPKTCHPLWTFILFFCARANGVWPVKVNSAQFGIQSPSENCNENLKSYAFRRWK